MGSKRGDAKARQLGQEMAERVLSRRPEPAVRRLEGRSADFVTITSTHSVPPMLLQSSLWNAPQVVPETRVGADEPLLSVITRRTAGTLIAEGDSWFDYPLFDVLTELEDEYGYEIESAARHGDTLESMAYSEGQVEGLRRIIEKELRRGDVIRGVLLSAGGNDLAGAEFSVLLNHVASGSAYVSESIIKGVIDERCRVALMHMLGWIGEVFREYGAAQVPVFLHGYDYPVPDGRGFLGGFGPLPGPWLAPGFRLKGFDDLDVRIGIMRDIIDRYNEMLASATDQSAFAHVHHVDLRGTLSSGEDYRDSWANELHPTEDGFKRIAARLAVAIEEQTLSTRTNPS